MMIFVISSISVADNNQRCNIQDMIHVFQRCLPLWLLLVYQQSTSLTFCTHKIPWLTSCSLFYFSHVKLHFSGSLIHLLKERAREERALFRDEVSLALTAQDISDGVACSGQPAYEVKLFMN